MNPDTPLMVWDGDCSFCYRWIERWQGITGERVEYARYQDVASRFPAIPRENFKAAVHLIERDGRVSRGAEAVFRSLSYAPGHGWALWLYRYVPLVKPVTEWWYRRVARNRPRFDEISTWIWGPHVVPPGESLTASIFLRALGVIFACAFLSLWVQVIGLAGRQGILPAAQYLHAIPESAGAIRFWALPTLCWLNASDGMLHALCATGTLASAALALGFAPLLSLVVAWAGYLSLATVCQDFLWFQWDSLLLEAGFLSMFLAPRVWRMRWRQDPPPSRAALWLLRWLFFRLMVSSAACKLASGDPTWRSLTALQYHYETQPLPPWVAWYAHHLPAGFQKLSVALMFASEGLAPFLVIAPRRLRFLGAAGVATLQILILVTGNYGIFNLLALALCIPLLDDGIWPWRWKQAAAARLDRALSEHEPRADTRAGAGPSSPPGVVDVKPAGAAPRSPRGAWPPLLIRPIAAVLIVLGLVPLLHTLRWSDRWLGPVPGIYRLISPFRVVDPYGLFAVMTTTRNEIIVEGSMDGATWQPYEFRWKPGDLSRRPAFVTPHMPRLDWQMWFAALGDVRQNPWFLAFCERLLQGSPPVRALLARNPFPTAPRFIRAELSQYHFTDAAQRRASGAWWRSEDRGPYVPALMLVNGRLALAQPPEGAR
jgi:predicted DCC family thiol-disulfide oxidoreductase YuxK